MNYPGLIAEFHDYVDGMTSLVDRTESGYWVWLKDEDSGITLPCASVYQDQESAIRYARFIVNVFGDD